MPFDFEHDGEGTRREQMERQLSRLKIPPRSQRPSDAVKTKRELERHDQLFGLDRWSPERIADLGYPGGQPVPPPLPDGVDPGGDDSEARED